MQLALPKRKQDLKHDPHAPGLELDRELARRIMKGEKEALALLVDRHLGAVYKYVMRYLGPGHEELASEVVRATFADALKRMKSYANGRSSVPMRLWLLKRANGHLARRRKLLIAARGPERSEASGLDSDAANARTNPESEELTALRNFMLRLPARHVTTLSLALFEEMSTEEMARTLGRSPARTMRLLRAALRRLDKVAAAEETAGESA
jgi:RNA polymerase sigma-70 factor (ECF subfamily)